ncbi:MAG: AAA family ATPase [Thermomicrobiales bacterium]
MILAELEIEDYKQFYGRHRFTPPPEGIVAIIGPNGAGKTTLFEAIEWCLYQPREIPADEVPTRGQSARPRVRLVLEDPERAVRYVIERSLKKSGTATAEIYREDAPESPIVQGSKAVTEYVGRQLIGLGHRAFVSTFFTRQKELTFFGSLRETERRREVSRLLGLETIREAQQLIAADRGLARNQASNALFQHQEASEGRDFAAERDEADRQLAERALVWETAEQRLKQAVAAHDNTKIRHEAMQAVQREDAALLHRATEATGNERAAMARSAAAVEQLKRLDDASARRTAAAAVAAQQPAREGTVRAFDLALERFNHRQRLLVDLERFDGRAVKASSDLQSAVQEIDAAELTGWRWTEENRARPADGVHRLIHVAESVDAPGATERAEVLIAARSLEAHRVGLGMRLTKYRGRLVDLQKRRDDLIEGGDPRIEFERLEERRRAQTRRIEEARAAARGTQADIEKITPVIAKLGAKRFAGERCPTCGQAFDEETAAETIAYLTVQLRAFEGARQKAEGERQALEAEAKALDETMRSAKAEVEALASALTSLDDGTRQTVDLERETAEAEEALRAHLASCGLTSTPSEADVRRANDTAKLLTRIAGSLRLLRSLENALRDCSDGRSVADAALQDLGGAVYDADGHGRARAALDEAVAARVSIQEIDRDLARRPALERELSEAGAAVTSAQALRRELADARAALAFDPAGLEAAREDRETAVAAERAARDASGVAGEAHRSALTVRNRLHADQERIEALAARAIERQRDADQLDRMYEEFNQFQRFVAMRLAPQLADHTSELLRSITEDKFDKVDFTDSYGIEVFDGPDEKFPMEEFSGGERDVIALCARLALSRFIGGQAKNPPGFLVLDEVFGSLDRDRRAQVLETLGSLAGTANAFQQLFIISHVDDVRLSPIFNEIWRVSEGPDGVSALENLSQTGGTEDG